MLSTTILTLLWIGVSLTEAGPLPDLKLKNRVPIHRRQLTNSTNSMIGVVPAVGNNPAQSSELALPTITVAATRSNSSQPSSTISILEPPATTSRAVLQLASIGSALNQTAQAVASKQIGIIQAVPNNPGLSPELNVFPSIDPSQLAAASEILASIHSSAGATTAESTSSTTLASSSTPAEAIIVASPSQTGPILVQSTSFPLVGSNPQPDISPTPEAASLAPSVVSIAVSSSVKVIPSLLPPNAGTQPALLPFIGTLGSPASSAVSSSTTRGPSRGRSGGRRPHHGSKSSEPKVGPAVAPTLAIPNPSANPVSVATTVTVPDPSGLVVVPINVPTTINNKVNNNDGTVTVTVTVASTTITASFLSVSTVTVTA